MSKEINATFLVLGLICLIFVIISLFMILTFKQSKISVLTFEKAMPYMAKQYIKSSQQRK